MKALLIILGILLLIGLIPIGVVFRYHGAVELSLKLAFFRRQILPKRPLSPKQQAKAERKQAKKAAQKAEQKKKQQAQSLIAKPPEPPKPRKPLRDQIRGLVPWAKLGVRFVGEFFHRRLCIRRLRIRVALAGRDPARLAVNTGRAWEAIGIAVPILERGFRIRDRKIVVYPDFTAIGTELEAELYVRILLGGVVLMLIRYAFRALRILLAARKAKKQTNQSETSDHNTEKVVSA